MAQANIDINLLFNDGGKLENITKRLEKIKSTVDTLSKSQVDSINEMITGFSKLTDSVKTLGSELKNAVSPKDIARITGALQKQGNAIKALENKANKAANSMTKVKTSTKAATGALGKLKATLKQLKIDREFAKDEAAVVKFNQRIQETEMAIRRMSNVGKRATNTFGNALTSFGFKFNLLANIASRVGSAITSGIISTFNGAIKTVIGFEQAQATLAAILGKTRGQINGLTEDAKKFGATTFFTATQVNELQIELAKMGFTLDQIRGATRGALDLAAAFRVDLATAAQVTASTLRGFNLEASEAGRVADVIASAFANSALDLEKFKVAINKVAPIAASLNVSLEATTAALGSLTNKGFDASTAGTQLRNIFLKFADTNSDLTKKIGFTVRSSDDFIAAFKELNKQGLKVTDTMQLVDKRSVALLQALIDSAGATGDLEEEFKKAGGTAKRIAEEQLKTFSGAMLLLKSAWDGFILSLDDGNGTMFTTAKRIVSVLTEVFNLVSGLGKAKDELTDSELALREAAERVIVLFNALKSLVAALVTYQIAIKGAALLQGIWNGVGLVGRLITLKLAKSYFVLAGNTTKAAVAQRALSIALASNPAGLIAIGVAALATSYFFLSKNTDKVTKSTKALTGVMTKFRVEALRESVNINRLFGDLKKFNAESNIRKQSLKEINKLYGKYLPNLLTEKSTLEDIAEAQKAVTEAIKSNIAIRTKKAAIDERVNTFLEFQSKTIVDLSKNVDQSGNAFNAFSATFQGAVLDAVEVAKKYNEAQRTIVEETEKVGGEVDKLGPKYFEALEAQNKFGAEMRAIGDKALSPFVGKLEDVGGASLSVGKSSSELSKSFVDVAKESARLNTGIEQLDDIFSKLIIKTLGGDAPDALVGLSGRLNKISAITKTLNKEIKALTVVQIENGEANEKTARLKALELEVKLIKGLHNERRNENALIKAKLEILKRENALQANTLEKELESIRLTSKAAKQQQKQKREALEDEIKTTQELLETTEEESKEGDVAAKAEAELRLANLLLLEKELDLKDDLIQTEKSLAENRAIERDRVRKEEGRLETEKLKIKTTQFKLTRKQEIGFLKESEKLNKSRIAVLKEEEKQFGVDNTNLIKEITDDNLKITADVNQKQAEQVADVLEQVSNVTNVLTERIGEFHRQQTDTRLKNLDKQEQAEIDILQSRLDQGIISQTEFETARLALEQDFEEDRRLLLRKQAQREKDLALFQATVAGVAAVSKAFASGGLPAAIAAAIFNTANLAILTAQPIPQFEQGGMVEHGMLYGPRHKKGGITVEAEGGEFFNDRKSTSAYLPYLEAANEMRLPEFIMANDVQPMLELQMAGVNKSFAKSMASSMGFYDGNIVRQLQSERKEMKTQTEILRDIAKNNRVNLRHV